MNSCQSYLINDEKPLLIIDEKQKVIFFNPATAKFLLSEKMVKIKEIISLENCRLLYLAKAEFFSEISLVVHQLRSPLVAIQWTTENSLKDIERQKQRLLDVLQSGRFLNGLVNDILEAAKMDSQKQPQKTKSDLAGIIQEAIQALKIYAEKKQQKIIFQNLAESAETALNPDLFKAAFQNLLDNAIGYGEEKCGIHVLFAYDETAKKFIVSVNNDKGAIIGGEEKPKIGEKFYRSEAAKKIKPVGSGLGLYIARTAVEANGGKLWFESDKEKGTTFHFSVPLL